MFIESRLLTDDPQVRALCEFELDGGCELNDFEALANLDQPELGEHEIWRWTTHRTHDTLSVGGQRLCRPGETEGDGCAPYAPVQLAPDYAVEYAPCGEHDGFRVDHLSQWLLFERDVPRWQSEFDGFDDFPGAQELLLPAEQSIPGVMWTHTPGSADERSVDHPTFAEQDLQGQASHYWSGRVLAPFDTPQIRIPPGLITLVPITPFPGSEAICPFCESTFPAPFWGFPSQPSTGPSYDAPSLLIGDRVIEPNDSLALEGLQWLA